jgi:hypothetical protein
MAEKREPRLEMSTMSRVAAVTFHSEISGSHGDEYEDVKLLGCCTV